MPNGTYGGVRGRRKSSLLDYKERDGGKEKEDGPYQLLSQAVAEGLLHVNCQHNLNTFYPGISTKPPTLDPSKVDEAYKETQRQRRLERAIRRQKRVVAGVIELRRTLNHYFSEICTS